MTRKKKILLTFSISFLLIGLIGFLFLRSSYFLDKFLKEPIIRVIEDQIDGKYTVYIDRLSGNIFTGVQAKEFRIREREPDVPPILTTTEIVLNYDFFGLLRRKLIISGIEINYPEFNILRNSDGQVNLTQVFREASQESDSTFTFDISNVNVKNGQINFIDEKHNTKFNLPDITLKVDGKQTETGHFGRLIFGRGSFSIDGKELSVDTLGKEIQFNLSTTGGNLQEHHLKFGDSDLILSGEWKNNKWELQAELSFDAADIEKFLIDDFQLNGNGKILLEVNGTNTTLNGSLIVEIPKLLIDKKSNLKGTSKTNKKQIDISNVIVDTSIDLNEESKIRFNELSLQIAEGSLSGSGSMTFDNTSEGNIIERIQHFAKNPISYNSNWDMSDVQLKPLIPIWIEIPPSTPQIKSGIVSGSAKISGNTYGDFNFNGNVQLSDTSLLTQTKAIKLQDSSLNCTIMSESEDSLTIMVDGKIDGADVDINGNLETPMVVLSNVDFGKLCEIANTLPLKGIGTITAQIKEDRTATGHIEIPDLFFDNDYIPVGRLAGDYRFQNGAVYFENAYLTKNGVNGDTKIAIEGHVKLEGELPVNMRIITEKLVLDEDYNRILLKNKYPIVGIISGELDLYNSLTHLDGSGEFRVESGVAWEIKLDPLQFQLDINDTSLTIQDFQITSRGQLVILNTHVSKTGDFDFSLKNNEDRPIKISEIAVAASIDEFPFDGLMDVNITSFYKKPDDSSTEVSLHITDLSFNNNPLGDGYVHGKLIEPSEQSTEPGYFNFIGKAFDDTTHIEGTVSIGANNPYAFTAISKEIGVTPILRIFHPTLESVTGTANSVVRIKGTIAELASTKQQDSNRRVYPYDVDIVINNTELQYNSLHFSNPSPIRIEIVDDIITFSDSSLAIGQDQTPFLQIAGTIDAKTEEINIVSSPNQDLTLNAFVKELNLPVSGLAYYDLKLQGTLSNPIVGVSWQIPSLVWNTDSGDISISNANGEFNYINNVLHIQPFSLELLNSIIQVAGDMTINQENFEKSQLNLNVNGDDIALTNFSDIVKNSLPDEVVNLLTARDTSFLSGNVNIQLNINGSIAEPIVDFRTYTVDEHPIYIGKFEKPLRMDEIHAVATIGSELVDIIDLLVKGQIGKSNIQVEGETSFSRTNNKEMNYTLGISADKLEIADFLKVFNVNPSLLNGQISGSVMISGGGFKYDDISGTSKIHELTLNSRNIQIVNITPFDLAFKDSIITTTMPLKLTSPVLDSQVDIGVEGPIITPKIDVNWRGSLINLLHQQSNLPTQWNGNIQYLDKKITILSEITNNGHSLKLTGLIPFNLNLREVTTPERFIDLPINVQLVGNELPLTFFPGIDTIFAEVDGVADINLSLKGTTRSPHLEGNVFIEASKFQTKSLNQELDKVRLQLNAREDLIELVQCKFEIGDGTFDLRKCELQLEGLMPKYLFVEDVSFKKYPLDSVLQNVLPSDAFKEVYGEVTTSISKMKISFDSYFQQREEIPIPKVVRSVNFDAITREAEAEFTVDHITLGFISLDKQYQFTNPETVPFTLNTGTFRLKGLRLENTISVNPEVTNPLVISCFGRLDLDGEIFANLKISNFNISSLSFFLPNELTQLYEMNGMLTTTVSITGEYAAPNILIRLEGDKLTINQAGIDEFSGEFRYDSLNQHWTIIEENTQIRIAKNRLICSGSVPLNVSLIESKVESSSDPMDIRISLIMDELGILPLIDPHVQSAVGEGNITASITGSVYTPKITGHGNFNIDSLSIARSPIYFENLESTFEFTEKGVRFDEMKGQLNGGHFTANGDIITDWFQIQNVDVKGSMKNSIFSENEKYQIELSSENLHLTGMITDTKLNGDIRIHSGQYKQNWDWGDLLNSFSAGTVTDIDLLFYAPFIRNLTLDLGIDIPNKFHLLSSTGGHTDIEIKCRGQLTGAIQAPIFTGDLSILRGKISIITQIFEIQEGSTIRNLSDKSFTPELDIILRTPNPIRGVVLEDGSVADLMITATVTGKLENGDIGNAKVNFGVDPINSSTTVIFTDADVLALLSPGNSISRSFAGITFTISSGFDPNQRHIIGEYPLPFGNNMSIRMEGDEKGGFGVDLQLLERRF